MLAVSHVEVIVSSIMLALEQRNFHRDGSLNLQGMALGLLCIQIIHMKVRMCYYREL